MATSRADAVFQPILDARTKAERLKSTLGVFERSKFFFNLPGILGEAVEAVSFDSLAFLYTSTDSKFCYRESMMSHFKLIKKVDIFSPLDLLNYLVYLKRLHLNNKLNKEEFTTR